jgi:hypothetical protein
LPLKHHRPCAVAVLLMAATWATAAYGQVNLVEGALEDSTFKWRSMDSEAVRIYYQPGSFAERHRAMLLRSASRAVGDALECLGEPEYDRLIHVFYLESREEMNRIVGRPVAGYANWEASGVFVVFNPKWRSFEKHEITHVLTMELWGSPNAASGWMIEGVPIYCDGWCRQYSVDQIALHLLSHGELPPLRDFFDDFATLGEIRAGFYAASLIGFIRETYGTDALRALWLSGHANLRELLGADVDQVETSWKQYLRSTVNEDTEVDMKTIEDSGCG